MKFYTKKTITFQLFPNLFVFREPELEKADKSDSWVDIPSLNDPRWFLFLPRDR